MKYRPVYTEQRFDLFIIFTYRIQQPLRHLFLEVLINDFSVPHIQHVKDIYQPFNLRGDEGLMDIDPEIRQGLGNMIELSRPVRCVDLNHGKRIGGLVIDNHPGVLTSLQLLAAAVG